MGAEEAEADEDCGGGGRLEEGRMQSENNERRERNQVVETVSLHSFLSGKHDQNFRLMLDQKNVK